MLTIRRNTSRNSANIARAIASLAIIAASAGTTGTAAAQGTEAAANHPAWELRIASGRLAPMGTLRDRVKNAPASALQVSWLANANLAVTSTVTWARSRDVAIADTPKLDVFTADLGAELRGAERPMMGEIAVSTFAGAGAGVRRYDHRNIATAATHNLAGYIAVGGELGFRRVAMRIEARDYLSGFKSLSGSAAGARNDVTLIAAMRFNRRAAASR